LENHWKNGYLVGGLEHEWIMTFHISGISSPQLTNMFQRGSNHWLDTNGILMGM
jgi:hypothetical protein